MRNFFPLQTKTIKYSKVHVCPFLLILGVLVCTVDNDCLRLHSRYWVSWFVL